MSDTLIEFRNVHKSFGETKVLDGVNLDIKKGELATVIGKSGTGKTVILKLIAGLFAPDSGEVLIEGRSIYDMSRKERRALKSRFGYMFQNVALFDSMTAYENVALPLREKTNMRETDIRDKVMDALEQLEVKHIAQKYPAQISGGMQKRVGLARVLVNEPEIILFDEPTTGLDPIRKNAVHAMISQMQARLNFTAVMVSHEIPDIFYFSHHVAMLDEGKMLADGTAQEVQQSIHPIVRDFIKGSEALRDELTGLDTKTAIVEKFNAEISRYNRYNDVFSVIVFHINNMDKLSEHLGYSIGQQVMQNFASLVSRSLRASDANSRYDEDSIVTILPGTHVERAWMVSRKVENTLKHHELLAPQGFPPLTFSISAGAMETGPDLSLDDLVRLAKEKMVKIGEFETS